MIKLLTRTAQLLWKLKTSLDVWIGVRTSWPLLMTLLLQRSNIIRFWPLKCWLLASLRIQERLSNTTLRTQVMRNRIKVQNSNSMLTIASTFSIASRTSTNEELWGHLKRNPTSAASSRSMNEMKTSLENAKNNMRKTIRIRCTWKVLQNLSKTYSEFQTEIERRINKRRRASMIANQTQIRVWLLKPAMVLWSQWVRL